ncbi:MAG: hypothetical protein R3D84_14895 [Paracoccaceae bacterium]
MKSSTAYMIAGAAIGLFTGASMGIAVGGTAYNASVIFAPLGAFIGWLLASRRNTSPNAYHQSDKAPLYGNDQNERETGTPPRDNIAAIVHSALAILATVWNFQIDILKVLGILPAFVRQPLLFAGLCLVVSIVFPPFLGVYFFAWLAANHFGLSEETQFRVSIK